LQVDLYSVPRSLIWIKGSSSCAPELPHPAAAAGGYLRQSVFCSLASGGAGRQESGENGARFGWHRYASSAGKFTFVF